MAVSAQKTRVLAGQFPLSTYVTSLSVDVQRAMLDKTTLTSEAQEFFPGMKMATLTVDSLVDSAITANNYWDTLTGFFTNGTLVPVTVSPDGIANGSSCTLAQGYLSGMAPQTAVADRVTASLTFTLSGGASPSGKNLVAHEAISTNTTGSAVDNAAGTTNGGVAHLHVTTASGTSPTCDTVVEHSTNNSTWSTLATFTQATSVTSQRVTVAAGTTVHRYLRAKSTLGGTSPNFTIAVAFARS